MRPDRFQSSTSASYGYGPSGRWLFKTVNGTTTWFLWDGTQLLAEFTASGSTTALTTRYDYLPGEFAPLQIETGNGKYSVHTDHLATPKLLTDSSGQVVWRSVRAAFGETTVNDDVDGNGVVVGFNIRFPGQYFDGESGLHYNYFRDYDPRLGRYIESDPIGLNGGANIYRYVQNNPLINIDIYGLVDISFLPPFSTEGKGAKNTNREGAITVSAHGYPGGITDKAGVTSISAMNLAEKIKNHPKYFPGIPVYIYACKTGYQSDSNNGSGSVGNRPPYGQQVADQLPKSTVYAPNKWGWFSETRFIGIFDPKTSKKPDYSKPGEWKEFNCNCD